MAIRYSDALPTGLRFEPTPKRVRAELSACRIADSERAVLVFEPDRAVPFYAFPEEDVRSEHLEPSAEPIADAHGGAAEYFTARVDGRTAVNAAWRYDDDDLRAFLAVDWESMDRWFEEDEEVFGHPRSPFHRVDVRRSARHVRVELDGELLADSRRPSLVFETGLPTRYYLPRDDVRMELLTPSETRTICAYKGLASYWSAGAGARGQDLAWTYEEPLPDNAPLRGLVSFLNEKLDITVDGSRVGQPDTQWSPGVRSAPRGGGSGAHQDAHSTSDTA